MLKELSDDIIIESYYRAVNLNLESDFILILKQELKKRGIPVKYTKQVI